jgi:hypothetical protein
METETVSPLANIDSATLVTEYTGLQLEAANIETRKDAVAEEIKRRLNLGLVVQNAKVEATLRPGEKRTYNVLAALKVIRKHKLDAAVLLSVVPAEVKKLPDAIQAGLPFISKPTASLILKPRK